MPTNPEGDALSAPVLLDATFDLARLDCGSAPLNEYLKRFAWANHQNRSARTYVASRGLRAVGYYTLAAGSVSREDAPPRVAKGLARHPVPVILMARLAVDLVEQGKGMGAGLLKDALRRCGAATETIGCRAVLVHAKDDGARLFYERWGFIPSPTSELHLMLSVKDIEAEMKG